MSEKWTGFKTFKVPGKIIEDLYCDEKIPAWDKRISLWPNMYVELKDELLDTVELEELDKRLEVLDSDEVEDSEVELELVETFPALSELVELLDIC